MIERPGGEAAGALTIEVEEGEAGERGSTADAAETTPGESGRETPEADGHQVEGAADRVGQVDGTVETTEGPTRSGAEAATVNERQDAAAEDEAEAERPD